MGGGGTVSRRFLCCFGRILFILAGNDEIHESLGEFKILLYLTTDYGVSCSRASEKNPHRLIMGTVSPLFLGCFIRSFSYLKVYVTRTYISAWMSSNFG